MSKCFWLCSSTDDDDINKPEQNTLTPFAVLWLCNNIAHASSTEAYPTKRQAKEETIKMMNNRFHLYGSAKI